MKAARLHAAGDLRIEDVDRPGPPPPGSVGIAVVAAGICGSDLHNFRTGQWISRAPSTAGHEFAGIVTAVGDNVSGLGMGDPVVADSRYWCGECAECRSGHPNLCVRLGFVGEVCDGGFAEHTVLPARLVMPCDPGLDPSVAAMAEPLAVALHAIRRQSVPAGETVLVAGCGPIGGLAALLLSRTHEGPVLLADRNERRLERTRNATGASALHLADDDALASVRYVVDATGSLTVLQRLVGRIRPGGSIALVGITEGTVDVEPTALVERETALIGCHAFVDELPEAVALLPTLQPLLKTLIDAEIDIDAIPDAYRRLLEGKAAGLKTVIRMTAGATMAESRQACGNSIHT